MSVEVVFRDELTTLLLGDGRGFRPGAGHIVVSDPPTELGWPFPRGTRAHLIVHPHAITMYPSEGLRHVSAWIRHSPGIVRDGFGHHWNAVLHYGPADLPTDVFWDDAPRLTDHPAERGVQPLVDLIASLPEGTILDPFCGTGSVLLAARRLGRPAVGVEIDPQWAEVARGRLSQ